MLLIKVFILLLSIAVFVNAVPANVKHSQLTALDDVGLNDNDNSSGSGKSLQVQKRSGSTDYVLQFKSGLLSTLGHASASAASSSSHGSSGHAYKFPTEEHHVKLPLINIIN